MKLSENVQFNNCDEIVGYLKNKVRYLLKNSNDVLEKETIAQDLAEEVNSEHLLRCALSSKLVHTLYRELRALM